MSDKLPYTLADVKPEQFDALVQKVEEIHRMLKERQPSVVMQQPYPMWHFPTVPSKTTGGTNER